MQSVVAVSVVRLISFVSILCKTIAVGPNMEMGKTITTTTDTPVELTEGMNIGTWVEHSAFEQMRLIPFTA